LVLLALLVLLAVLGPQALLVLLGPPTL